MALLTAEDVLNKAFSKTKYREGFDQDEVDDFLDEVAHTISVLTAERDDLAQRLAAVQASGGAVAAAPAGQPGSLLEAATDPNQPGGTEMVAMAQKLQDEYVKAGEEERDRIIDEARAKADELMRHAESDASTRMDQLALERSSVERKIDDLRRFERDYRARLKTYLENLLGDLDHGAAPSGAPASGPAFPSTGSIAAVAAAGGLEGAVGVGEDTVPYEDETEAEAEESVEDTPVADEAAEVQEEEPVVEAEPEPEPVAAEDAAPAWSAAMPTFPAEPEVEAEPAGEPEPASEFGAAPSEYTPAAAEYSPAATDFGQFEPAAETQPEPEPEPAAAEPEPFQAFEQPAERPEQPAPYQPRMFAAPEEPVAASESEPESAPAAEEAPSAPARPSLFSTAPQVASPYTPQFSPAPEEQSAPEPEAPAYTEPPRYEAPTTQATPMWAPTTSAVPQQQEPAQGSAPSGESPEAEDEAQPKSDIYDIRSIFGDVTPRDENR
ncbi:DivIVA domain-containing protein [Demequina zhanjiangensis]|uniref:Cell wall synthesis protein Wag31 n=1 Tax=Demequina zhanjiangensis TaxID=3051659 RepID=A0ABT8G3H5_9MICO|nr:DivIVA domain-containing protein [Demequina sp. SYSU T00b26]MDN4473678.1 DivIVA domain-containing protein [Demequina sp. SYSU T00b26]